MKITLSIVFVATALAAAGTGGDTGASAAILRERFEAGVRGLVERQDAKRDLLEREYLSRLKRFERTARWRRQRGAEATAERKRFENERAPLREGFSSDPEVARLQAILAGAFAPLERQLRDSTFSLANAYLYRLKMAKGRAAAKPERSRLVREYGLPLTADGTTDITPAWASRIEISPDVTPAGELCFDLGALEDEGGEIGDSRLRLVSVKEAKGGTPIQHKLLSRDGKSLAEWPAPAAAYSIVTLDLTEWVKIDEEQQKMEFRLEPAGHYAPANHWSPWSRPRLLIDDAAAAMVPRGEDGELTAVEVFPPRPPRD